MDTEVTLGAGGRGTAGPPTIQTGVGSLATFLPTSLGSRLPGVLGNQNLAWHMCPWTGCFKETPVHSVHAADWRSRWALLRSQWRPAPCPVHEGRRGSALKANRGSRGSREWWAYRAAGRRRR